MVNLFDAKLEPLNKWTVLFLLQHKLDVGYEIVFSDFVGDVTVSADFAADAA